MMMRTVHSAFAGLVGAGLFATTIAAGQAPQSLTIPIGTARLSGTVTAADGGTPLPGTQVTLKGEAVSGQPLTRMMLTDSAGRFVFDRLPAGRFSVTAYRDLFLPTTYGQKRNDGPGTTVPLAAGQRLALSLQLTRASVIAGVVTGADGRPLPKATVVVFRYASSAGVRQLLRAGQAQTDDRGAYRVFNLQPGEHIVSALPFQDSIVLAAAGVVETAIAGAPAVPAGTASSLFSVPTPSSDPPVTQYAPNYYPGGTDIRAAATIRLGAAEERNGTDITIVPRRPQALRGMVVAPPGLELVTAVSLRSAGPEGILLNDGTGLSGIARPDGSFRFASVVPGSYELVAEAMMRPNAPTATPTGPRFWARASITVDGQPLPDFTLALQPGRSIAGHVLFEQTRIAANVQVTVGLVGELGPGGRPYSSSFPPIRATVAPDGTFVLQGVGPGRYTFEVSGGGTAASAIVAGTDTLDFPLEFSATDDLSGVVITMTDTVAELSGTLSNQLGGAATDPTIVVASADARFWTARSRRIAVTRPGADGRYIFRGLPPGDYLIAAVDDLSSGDQFDPEFLRALSSAAVRVVLAKGARVSQNLRLVGARP